MSATRGRGATGERMAPTGAAPSLDRLLQDWRGAQQRVLGYLAGLGLPTALRELVARRSLERALSREPGGPAVSDALDEVVEELSAEGGGAARHPLRGDAFERLRLGRWLPEAAAAPGPFGAPPLQRTPMAPEPYRGRRLGALRRRPGAKVALPPEEREQREARRLANRPWSHRARARRLLLAALVVAPSAAAGSFALDVLPGRVGSPVEILLAVCFGALFGWISVGFWTALFGFVVLLRRGDRFAITRGLPEASAEPPLPEPGVRVALLMPVRHEPNERVFAGLRAVRESLARAGAGEAFDLFVLSDSDDPDHCVDEEEAWARLRRATPGPGGVFYRRRHVRRKRKSGNVADFCRRYGRLYRYMVVLDADSVMSGTTLLRLVQLMEENPGVGILQTATTVVRARSLFARLQQLASRLYGPMFAAGMHYWQLGDSPYWGHNAILRVEPFMRHCALPRLSGRPPLGGDILSHDFVEAALLGRAEWSLWLAFDVSGSFEETPASLLEEMERDRRWCQGNLQHLRLLLTEGVSATHRALFLNGVFSYVSAIIWLAFLGASTAEAVLWALRGPDYFPTGPSLFPTWPVWRPERAAILLSAVLVVLFLPKLLAVVLVVVRRQARAWGGVGRLLASVLVESLASALFAPIRMVFYCRFVLLSLLGSSVRWGGSGDEHEETRWGEAILRHGPDTVVATVWALAVHALHPQAFWWLSPVVGALVLSVPLSVLASRERLGARARRLGLLLTPEEISPPHELRTLEGELAALAASRPRQGGLSRAVVDPRVNALHAAFLRGPRRGRPALQERARAIAQRALAEGPEGLAPAERRILLGDALALRSLHAAVWRLSDPEAAGRWGLPAPTAGAPSEVRSAAPA